MELGDDTSALEASLLENFARLDPDEVAQWETFARLVKEGRSVTDIAATFGITEVMVKRRLALGNLLPRIRQAYRNEDIDTATVRVVTLPTKAQQLEWIKLFRDPEAYAPRAWQLKQWLFGGSEISTDAALFPLDAYTGHIVTDLFGERKYFADTEQFRTLQNEAIPPSAMRSWCSAFRQQCPAVAPKPPGPALMEFAPAMADSDVDTGLQKAAVAS